MKKLRIAQVGTIWETIPPKLYGGTERVIFGLTEKLVALGHDVTLYATGDSTTSAKLRSTYPQAAYREGLSWENFLFPFDHISQVFYDADRFDIIHVHLNRSQDYTALVLSDFIETPVVFTLHFELVHPNHSNWKNWNDRYYFLTKHRNHNFISVSDAQRTLDLNFIATVHNGLNFTDFTLPATPGENLIWLGRICHEKGTKEAIEVAKKTGLNLVLAGKTDREKYRQYTDEVMAMVDGEQIRYIGEINDQQKIELFKTAKALLMPINWNEPFGLVQIEAMAMGVPTIAFDVGPIREIIINGKTGFVVQDTDEMAAALHKIDELNRTVIQDYALSNFSDTTMTDNYLKVYGQVIRKNR